MATKKATTEAIVIRRVRSDRKSIFIEWVQGIDVYKVTFHENPLASFTKAITALAAHVCSLCEFPDKDEAKITPSGITVTENGDNNLALIVASKRIKKGKRVFNITTPLLSMYPDKENKATDCMAAEEARAIEKVITEAKKYLDGDRAQGIIKFEDDKDEKDAKKDKEETEPLKFEGPGAGPDGP